MLVGGENQSRRRQEKTNGIKFSNLILVPATTTVKLPASASFVLKSAGGCSSGTLALLYTNSSGAKTVKAPLLVAGGCTPSFYLEKDITVTISAGFSLLIDIGMGIYKTVLTP